MGVGEGEKQDRAEGEVELQSSYAKSLSGSRGELEQPFRVVSN